MKEIRETSETEDVLFTPRFIPMSLGKPVLKVACGHFLCCRDEERDIWTWGAGESGQLGSGRCTFRELPTKANMESRNAEAGRVTQHRGGGHYRQGTRKESLLLLSMISHVVQRM